MRCFVLLIAALFCASCSRYDVNQLFWIEGDWTDSDRSYFESWRKGEDGHWHGKAFQLNAVGDTMYTENLAIAQIGYGLSYIAEVSNQNGGDAITFSAREVDPDRVLFMNPKHDYPQKITYHLLNSSSISVVISDLQNQKSNQFLLNKITNE